MVCFSSSVLAHLSIGSKFIRKMALVDVFLAVVKAAVFVYDTVTFPIYALAQTPWAEKTRQNLGRVRLNDQLELHPFDPSGNCQAIIKKPLKYL